jgi:hypothetical protein
MDKELLAFERIDSYEYDSHLSDVEVYRKLVPAEQPIGWIYLIRTYRNDSICFVPFPTGESVINRSITDLLNVTSSKVAIEKTVDIETQ